MKKTIQGTVNKAFTKQMDQPKTFTWDGKTITNTHRRSIQVNGEWIGLGEYTPKFEEFGSIWTKNGTIQEGTEVMVVYEESPCGKYKNAKIGQVTILGGNTAPVRNDKPQSQTTGGTAKPFVGKANPAEVGQAINLAASVLGYQQADFADPARIASAITWYKTTKESWTKAFDGEVAEAPKPQPKQEVVTPTTEVAEDNFDEDIPF